MGLHDQIASLALNHFDGALPKTGKPTSGEWTVVSAIIKEDCEGFEVVALGSGSKCIGGQSMSKAGDVLNDSHAEVMARRGFLRFLYGEIGRGAQSAIFRRENGRFVLNDGVRFHFFTTHAPCGDAAVFPKADREDCGKCLEGVGKRNSETDGDLENKRLKNERGDIYRTGGKCLASDPEQDLRLQGSRYHLLGKVRTKPGRGDPTLSVSCSDKLAKWLHVGVQGALLSLFIPKPIRFASFTITKNAPFCENALRRCLFQRLNCNDFDLPIGQSSLSFDYCRSDNKRPSPNSIVWYKTANGASHEVAVAGKKLGITKKMKDDPKSRLSISKVELFRCFLENAKSFRLLGDQNVEKLSYHQAKLLACDYQGVWQKLKSESFKIWTSKDVALLDFYAS